MNPCLQVDHHDSENTSLLRFNALWESLYRHDSLLVFSTGRSPTLYKQLRKEKPMLTPDITIMSVGTEITYGDLMVPDNGWVDILNQNWDKSIIIEETSKFPQLTAQVIFKIFIMTFVIAILLSMNYTDDRSCCICCNMQAATEQRPHKISFYIEKGHAQEVIRSLSDAFQRRGVKLTTSIWFSMRFGL